VQLTQRTASRAPLNGRQFDLLVIGGGINGVAIARECARGGRRTLLVEQNDFASGTTSRSTRIIHGGLRYLEHGDIAQVRESLRERQQLLCQHPHLVHPLQFLLVLGPDSRRSALTIRAGLWFYRRLEPDPIKAQNAAEQQTNLERVLDSGKQLSIFSFEDAQCEFPERLVAEWLLDAMAGSCEARNHTQLLEVKTSNGHVTGARLRDELTGAEEQIECKWIINATGPWADLVCENSGLRRTKPMVGGVRGSHIVLPRFAGAPEAAVYTEAVDGRPFFIVPWNDQILVGTTEVPDNKDPRSVKPSDDEIVYLFQSFSKLFPKAGVSAEDILWSFAGVRPLPYSPQSDPNAITRRHELHDHTDDGAAGMISVIGGKLTTAGCVARECAAKIGAPFTQGAAIEIRPCRDVDRVMERAVSEISQLAHVSPESAREMVEWQGRRSFEIARRAGSNAEMRMPLCSHTSHTVAEAVDAFENQRAMTLGDVLLRRVPVGLGACWSSECTREAATLIGAAIGWDAHQIATEIDRFEAECEAFLQKTSRSAN